MSPEQSTEIGLALYRAIVPTVTTRHMIKVEKISALTRRPAVYNDTPDGIRIEPKDIPFVLGEMPDIAALLNRPRQERMWQLLFEIAEELRLMTKPNRNCSALRHAIVNQVARIV